ncbi:uncharacterized protein N0V89_002608 [Didymosphaeria variabile]|uniref:Uncharacterized protein n=1 Tax=Didymosphaeria variabile TaxID=1932322 RepID=A0A9W9CEP5_9PLEO|nr:uncharacterized protein N0V89_002608 [Didymosphaeria variabile]KAJ4358029.1 hypothetical protein N0V89_002608 [Didymosphaeria variabile]
MDVAIQSEHPPWFLANDSWDAHSRVPLTDSECSDWDDITWFGCLCCRELSSSDIVASQQGEDLFAADLRNESYMNAAGRTTMHPFRDMRAASYARKRSHRFPDSRPRTRSIGGRKKEHADRRRNNNRRKRDILRYEIHDNQQRKEVWSPGKSKNMELVVWETNAEEEFDEHVEGMMDDVIRYEKLHKNAEVFENPEHYVETGETFSAWAQRRITEMRAVKESRLRRMLTPRQRPMTYATYHLQATRVGVVGFDYSIFSATTRTAMLFYVQPLVNPNGLDNKRGLIRGYRFSPGFMDMGGSASIHGAGTEMHLAVGRLDTVRATDAQFPALAVTAGTGDFGDEIAPDEQQTCSLVEWVSAEGRKLIFDEALAKVNGHENCGSNDGEDSEGEWSFVDEYCGVKSCSSIASSNDIERSSRS